MIFLAGFMGTGKTTVARLVGERLCVPWCDMDDLIEAREGRTITAIFQSDGEQYFRDVEHAVVRSVCAVDEIQVVACGGGVVLNSENISRMKDSGIIICLYASADVIYARTQHQTQRPLLQVADPQARIAALLSQRKSFYAQADETIDTSTLSPAQVADEVVRVAAMHIDIRI